MRTRICTVLARRGSRGVPGKNKRLVAGKPLAVWTIDLALNCRLFEAVVVSSDDADILALGRSSGAQLVVQRPDDLASDTAGKIPSIRHAADAGERFLGRSAETIVDLDVTSPLRSIDDVAGAVHFQERKNVSSVITGSRARRSPYFNLVELAADGHVVLSKPPSVEILRRQDVPKCFDMNASIYVWRRDAFFNEPKVFYDDTLLYEMPEERSIDIDSELDFEIVDHLMRKRMGQP